jgi:hypothetical protein
MLPQFAGAVKHPSPASIARRDLDVRSGSLAATARSNWDVRFTPESCRGCCRLARPLWAITDQVKASNKGGFDHYCALAAFIGRTKKKRDDG